VDSQNLHRRHLTTEFRRQRVAELRAQGMSIRKIAETIGSPASTVQSDLKSGVRTRTPEAARKEDTTPRVSDSECERETLQRLEMQAADR
jgi:IS30 family transposase